MVQIPQEHNDRHDICTRFGTRFAFATLLVLFRIWLRMGAGASVFPRDVRPIISGIVQQTAPPDPDEPRLPNLVFWWADAEAIGQPYVWIRGVPDFPPFIPFPPFPVFQPDVSGIPWPRLSLSNREAFWV